MGLAGPKPFGKVNKCMVRKHEPYDPGTKPCKKKCGRYTANKGEVCTRCLNRTLPLERKVVKQDARSTE